MKNQLAVLFAVAVLCLVTACKTVGPDGQPVYDPVRSRQVVATLTVPVKETITRVIRNSPEHSDEIANYIRAVGNVFCQMKAAGKFEPATLISEIDRATAPLLANVDPLIITTKNVIIALYTIFYEQRHTAELSPTQWPAHVAELFCLAIDGGLRDADKQGVDLRAP